jgi:hypothetical protein
VTPSKESLLFENTCAFVEWVKKIAFAVGSETNPELITARINHDFVLPLLEARVQENVRSVREGGLFGYYAAQSMARELGYTTEEVGGGFFRGPKIVVVTPSNDTLRFKSRDDFVEWAQKTLCGSV